MPTYTFTANLGFETMDGAEQAPFDEVRDLLRQMLWDAGFNILALECRED